MDGPHNTLEFLPKIPFKLTQSIQLALQKSFPAKIEQTLMISQKSVFFHWMFFNVIPFWLKNSGPNKQIIVT